LEIFKKRQIKKTYIALIGGDLSKTGEIKVPIARSKYVFGKFAVSEEGKIAETHFKVIKKYKYLDKIYSLVEINLKTGRTHQIRKHFMKYLNPIYGDCLYGNYTTNDELKLFCFYYKFRHPVTKQIKEIKFMDEKRICMN